MIMPLPSKGTISENDALRKLKIAYLETPLVPKPDPLYSQQRVRSEEKVAKKGLSVHSNDTETLDGLLAPRRDTNTSMFAEKKSKNVQRPVRHFAIMSMLPFWKFNDSSLPVSPISSSKAEDKTPGGNRPRSRPKSRAHSGAALSAADRAKQFEAAKLGLKFEPEVRVQTVYEQGIQLSGKTVMPLLPRVNDDVSSAAFMTTGSQLPGKDSIVRSFESSPKTTTLNPRPSTALSRSTRALPVSKLYVRQNPKHSAGFGKPTPSEPAAKEYAARLYQRGFVAAPAGPDLSDNPYLKSPPGPSLEKNVDTVDGWGRSSRSVRSGGNVRPHSRAALIPTPRHVTKHHFVDVVTRRVMKPEPKIDPRWQATWDWDPLAPPRTREGERGTAASR